jgi:hypothetical protein
MNKKISKSSNVRRIHKMGSLDLKDIYFIVRLRLLNVHAQFQRITYCVQIAYYSIFFKFDNIYIISKISIFLKIT